MYLVIYAKSECDTIYIFTSFMQLAPKMSFEGLKILSAYSTAVRHSGLNDHVMCVCAYHTVTPAKIPIQNEILHREVRVMQDRMQPLLASPKNI